MEGNAKVVKTAIGPHLTLIINEAKLLGRLERRDGGFNTTIGLIKIERTPQPKKRKLSEEPPTHLESIVRIALRCPLYPQDLLQSRIMIQQHQILPQGKADPQNTGSLSH